MRIFLLLTMLFFHIVDDYYLQGWLAQAKQRKYWFKLCGLTDKDIKFLEEHEKDKIPIIWDGVENVKTFELNLYKNDYKMALVEHAFSWTFMIHLPIMAFIMQSGISTGKEILFVITFTVNWIIHTFVDDLKANKLKINLVQDQTIHFIQIILTWVLWHSI